MGNRVSRSGEPFFTAIALILLAIVLCGFGPSFYLRGDDRPPLSTMLVLHGSFLTAWYVLFVVQSSIFSLLPRSRGIGLHRRLGMASVIVVLGALWTGVDVSVTMFRRGESDLMSPAALLWANLFNLIGFIVCYTAGVMLRRDGAAHKRFMTLAGITVISPAAFRLAVIVGLSGIMAVVIQAMLIASLFAYDMLRRKRIHRASWIGLLVVTVQVGGSFTLGESDVWTRIVGFLFS